MCPSETLGGAEPTTVTRQHWNTNSTTYPLVTVANTYIYDQVGRKLKSWEQITNGNSSPTTKTLLSLTGYNEVGQVTTKSLHSTDSVNYLQAIAYTYNERGWLVSSSAPLFAMQLYYNTGTNTQYNGNIAYQYWGVPGNLNNNYTYTYDKLNRLTSGVTALDNYKETGITYDQEGNITALNRYQAGTQIDQLTYTYTSSGNPTNQLQNVVDVNASNSGLVSGTTNYTYDGNGNMLSGSNTVNTAQNKSFTYNLLNLPIVATVATGTATYTYDATGNKLRKVDVISGTTTATDYISGIQYGTTSGTTSLSFIQTEEGKAAVNGTGYDYTYYLGDNLGNTRVTFGTKTGAAVLYQQDDYYPFGLEINRSVLSPKNEYLYNKKELQEEFTEYDYGARFYDPVIGRWNTVDPHAERSRKWSPYNYVSDNPISRVDPDGMDDYTIDKKSGDIKLNKTTKDGQDKIVKTDKNGNIKTKGQGLFGFLVSKEHKDDPRTAIGGIEKGILKADQVNNFQKQGNLINVGGTGQPSVAGVEGFALNLSNYVNKEIGGTYFSKDGGENTTAISLGGYGGNTQTQTNSNGEGLGVRANLTLTGFFHTHPTLPGRDPTTSSPQDRATRDEGLEARPDLHYYLIYDGQGANGESYIKRDFTKDP